MSVRTSLIGIALAVAAAGVAAPSARAQNTSGVSNADVKAGDRAVEYRAAFAPAHDGREAAFAHRLHYQHSFNDSWRARVIVSQRKRGDGDLDFRSATLDARWQFLEDEEAGWDSAFNFDVVIPDDGDGPGRVRVGWLAKVEPGEGPWELRGNLYAGREYGDRARDGLTLETRFEATRGFGDGFRFGAQMFNDYNATADLGGFDDQRHQLGFVAKGKIARGLKYEAGALFGLSARAPDADMRFFLSYGF
ncbi:hypothetical protein [Amphiplicatus metriothermophilus]|uniref:hypothetical protein n=1 Tax=Amphiplicatus metriothermophilus TaxID=1519374 RepID=UPI0011779738|nr:hypothetical protein [Amphiplicatus metriothermophilus]MBB5519335.1 hypothetical protein [Amphiplicatus metriothermophilus]